MSVRSEKLTISQFCAAYPPDDSNRHVVEKTDSPVVLVLEGGSTVTKGRDHTLIVSEIGQIAKFKVELISE